MADTKLTTLNVETASGLKVAGVAITATPTEINAGVQPTTIGADGLGRLGVARFTFDPTGDASMRTIAPHGMGVTLPINAVVLGGFVDVNTVFHSAGADAGTIAIMVEGAGDIMVAAACSGAPWSTIGLKAVVPLFTVATMKKATAAREITVTVVGQALTGGKFTGILLYAVSAVSA